MIDIQICECKYILVYILWRAAWKPEYLNRSGRPLLDNDYNMSGVCIVVKVTIVIAFTRQRIHRRFLHSGDVVFITTDKPNPLTRCSLLSWPKIDLQRYRHR
jgi:hypothetical protein